MYTLTHSHIKLNVLYKKQNRNGFFIFFPTHTHTHTNSICRSRWISLSVSCSALLLFCSAKTTIFRPWLKQKLTMVPNSTIAYYYWLCFLRTQINHAFFPRHLFCAFSKWVYATLLMWKRERELSVSACSTFSISQSVRSFQIIFKNWSYQCNQKCLNLGYYSFVEIF